MSWKPTEHPWFTLPTKEEAQAIVAERDDDARVPLLSARRLQSEELVLTVLIAVKEEEQLLSLFMELSTTAFIGLEFDDFSAQLIDEILLHAQEVSATFAVDSSQTH